MKMHKLIHLTDQHFCHEDKEAIDASVEAIKILKPQHIVLGGDLLDCESLSRFVRSSQFQPLVSDEIDAATRYLRRIRRVAPKARIDLTLGNHEERLQKYIFTHAQDLADIPGLTWKTILPCEELDIHVHKWGKGVTVGGLWFTHGTMIRKWGGSSARANIDFCNRSVVTGHSHRLAMSLVRRGSKVYEGYESGCLCKLWPPYKDYQPEWQSGFSVFLFWGGQKENHQWIPIHLSQKNPMAILRSLAKDH